MKKAKTFILTGISTIVIGGLINIFFGNALFKVNIPGIGYALRIFFGILVPYGSPLILIAGIALLIQNKRNASSKATPVTKKEEIKKRKKHAAFFIIGGSIAVITNAIIFAPFADPNGFGSPKNEALAWIDGIITIMGLLATLFGSVEYFSTIRKRGKKISLSLYSL